MEKLVIKTAVKTVLIILGIIIIVFAIFNFAFPQHMATATESIGNYSLAVKYADLRYKYTKSGSDLARCFDDSVLLGDDKYIIEYGEKLIAHKDYLSVCTERNESEVSGSSSAYGYDNWVKSKLCVSLYNSGSPANAIMRAAEYNGNISFAYGNPLIALASKIKAENNVDGATLILAALKDIHPEETDDKECLNQITATMISVQSGTVRH